MRELVIARIKGGLGNQLFCYAAARRLALKNGVELVLDDVSGFARDRTYRRRYVLDRFSIPCRKATPSERMEPFERARRAVAKWRARHKPIASRAYIEQQGNRFEKSLIDFIPSGVVYLDGLWQDERYFWDIEPTIRAELSFRLSPNNKNIDTAKRIKSSESVALHVRWFAPPGGEGPGINLSRSYYQHAFDEIERTVPYPHYYLFSDEIAATIRTLDLPADRLTCVDHNPSDEGAIYDLWLMSQCKHFIIANSTFSWWGAWLGRKNGGNVLMPRESPPMDGGLVWQGDDRWIATSYPAGAFEPDYYPHLC